jgi:hypothetical protein
MALPPAAAPPAAPIAAYKPGSQQVQHVSPVEALPFEAATLRATLKRRTKKRTKTPTFITVGDEPG